MVADELRTYLLIDASAPRTDEQWQSLIGAVKNKPMCAAIRQAVHAVGPQNKIELNRQSLTARYLLGDFEIAREDKADLLVVLDDQCAARGIVVAGVLAKFAALIQAELRESAIDLGYTVNQSFLLSVAVVGLGEQLEAIGEATLWFLANIEEWEI